MTASAPSWDREPKVELHLHLDCCLSFDAARRLDPSLTLDTYRAEFVAPAKCTDLMHLLRAVDRPLELLQTEEGLEVAVDDLFAQLARDRVVYAEIRFAPLLHTRGGLDADRVMRTVLEQAAAASEATGVASGILVCTLRQFSEAESLRSAELAAAGKGAGVVGFDIAGNEAGFPLAAHVRAFERARRAGLGITAHAGEALGPASVRDTLASLRPTRLGHGVRSVEDSRLVEELCRLGVHLEICPTSNVQSDVCDTIQTHPIGRLRTSGVSHGINTDGRTLCDVTLADEYRRLATAFGFDSEDARRANREALDASFAPDDVKASALAALG